MQCSDSNIKTCWAPSLLLHLILHHLLLLKAESVQMTRAWLWLRDSALVPALAGCYPL